MVNYTSCKARPPFSVGLSLQDICNKFGIDNRAPAETKEEAPVEELKPEVTPEQTVETPVEEPASEPIVEPKIETPVEEPVEDTPVEDTPVEEVPVVTPLTALDLSAKHIKQLEANGINSVEDLVAFEGDLEALPKIGRAAKQAVMEALTKWQNEQNKTTSTEKA